MKRILLSLISTASVLSWSATTAGAQELGPAFTKIKERIYVFAAAPANSTWPPANGSRASLVPCGQQVC